MRRCLRPPPKTEAEFEKIICSTWGSISSQHASCLFVSEPNKIQSFRADGREGEGSSGFYFSVGLDASITTAHSHDALAHIIELYLNTNSKYVHLKKEISFHPFMRSLIFHIIIHPEK